ncbi:hypothetical protein [Stigmatella erecta]|uniref:Lipoprotein n=1 Tax=Stigmatella erecta TaxID=83460 RepID=A0A1I0CZQ2_9BACT|nr:hypothetical protein [Stigmatella erecta]SET25279.1 hypothetical protein SAMN05443639_102319 [Stigmatella erecta]
MTRWPWAAAVLVLGVGCNREGKEGSTARAELRRVSGSTLEVIPNEGQLPYCLLYTVSQKGVIRQLTMTRENRSIKCETGRPIANTSFRIPAQEGPVKLYVIFSDQRIPAGSVAQQLYELRDRPNLSGMDFRLHGQAFVEQLEFTPEDDGTPVTGGVVGQQGEVADGLGDPPPDAAEPAPPQDGGT